LILNALWLEGQNSWTFWLGFKERTIALRRRSLGDLDIVEFLSNSPNLLENLFNFRFITLVELIGIYSIVFGRVFLAKINSMETSKDFLSEKN